MKNNTNLKRNGFSFTSVLIGAAVLSGLYFYQKSNTRQYSSGIKIKTEVEGADGMAKYFFNARKNSATGKMDYDAMAKASLDANAASNSTSRTAQTTSLAMNWVPMGPSNIGGRTRAILVDNQHSDHQTLFACAVSGGIWKSTNGGQLWDSVTNNDQFSSMEACDIAQDPNGVLYVGTGEGFSFYSGGELFSSAMIGGGIFKSTDDGNTWNVIASTVPTPNNTGDTWAYVNRIAIDPNNTQNIYAATEQGLMVSSNGGGTWAAMKNSANNRPLGAFSMDVKMSTDGSLLLSYTNNHLWYANVSGTVTQMTQVSTTLHHGGVVNSSARMEIAISPSNPNYAYVSAIGINGAFGQGATAGAGIYMTMTAKTNGGYWYNIGPGGSNTFDPYSSGGSQEQGGYDNAITVHPSNPGKILVAGTVLWTWYQATSTDTAGTWTDLTYYGGWPHPDMHALTYDPGNPNIVYDGNDGGVYKSFDGGANWQPMNRNYNVTQFNSIAFAPYMSNPVKAGLPGEGVMGGTQDNGTPYIGGTQFYYEDAIGVGGGDGGRSEMSQVDPNVFFETSDNNSLYRGGSLSSAPSSQQSLYSNTVGDTIGANLDSMVTAHKGGGCFYHQIALWESNYDTTKNLDMMKWIADSNYVAGKTVYPISPNGNAPFPYKLKTAVSKGETLTIKNPVVSKIAAGFSTATQAGVWIMMQAADLTDPQVWMPIGDTESRPDPLNNTGDPFHALMWSPDGDALFAGTQGGTLYRFSNLDSVVDNQYTTGALYSILHGGGLVVNRKSRVKCNRIAAWAGRDIINIAVDPMNGNNVMVVLGNYGNSTYVYYSTNALGAATFVSVQGNLPAMPVYSCVVDVINSGSATSALVGTERGIYSTTNLGGGNTWTKMPASSGCPNTLIADLKQQTLPPWNCNNSGNVYVGTHGRGAWVSTAFYKPLGIQPVVADVTAEEGLKVYPNPMSSVGTVEFFLPNETANVSVTVYDISGKVVKTIAMDNQSKGQHMVNINAENLSTGTYIACVTGDGFRKSARFVVVK